MPKKFIAALLAAAAAAAQAQAVQPEEQSPPGDIVVEGSRNVDRQIGDFVRALTDVPMSGQVSRFDWAVCPAVIGLTDRQNDAAAARMREVAGAAGIRVAGDRCRPNVLLIVTPDTGQLVDWLRAEHPAYFEGVPETEKRRLARSRGPAAAWHIEGRLDADGVEVPRDRITGQYTLERTDLPSRMAASSRPHFTAAVVVVDSDALAGLTVVQLADYAAMRAFARTDPSRAANSGAPTILNILESAVGSAVPITLTQWDLAYLKALYASTGNRTAGQQRREISRDMAAELSKVAPEED